MNYLATCRNILFPGAFALLTLLSGCDKEKFYTVKTETIRIDSLDQVIPLEDSLVKPIVYTHLAGFDNLQQEKAKSKFISAVLPAILIAKHKIETTKRKIIRLGTQDVWRLEDSVFYLQQINRYKAKDLKDLILRCGTLPNSIILAQAAVETGWGESRFFVEANNLFGIWSVNANEPRIAAVKMRKKKTIWLRSYPDISVSIVDYLTVLSRSAAYRNLRRARTATTDPFKLIPHLKYYSEQRSIYVNQLKAVIRQNDLTKYDSYKIDPQYLEEE